MRSVQLERLRVVGRPTAAEKKRLDDAKVQLLPLRNYPGVPGNGHPTAAEHEAMADEIEPAFRAALR